MRRERNLAAAIASAAIFIGLEVAAFAMIHSSRGIEDVWLNRFSHRTMAALWGGADKIGNYFSLKEKNDSLMKDVFALEAENRALKGALDSLMLLDEIPEIDDGFTYTFAKIVKQSTNSQHNYIILNKGSLDGVSPKSGIVTRNGVVGIVDAVDKHYCYGITFMNTNLSVSARLGRSGITAPLVWDGRHSNGALLKGLPINQKITPGDTLWTSGYSSLFPSGIPLGIAEETTVDGGASLDVRVRTFEDFSKIEFVTIVQNVNAKEITILESREEGR